MTLHKSNWTFSLSHNEVVFASSVISCDMVCHSSLTDPHVFSVILVRRLLRFKLVEQCWEWSTVTLLHAFIGNHKLTHINRCYKLTDKMSENTCADRLRAVKWTGLQYHMRQQFDFGESCLFILCWRLLWLLKYFTNIVLCIWLISTI